MGFARDWGYSGLCVANLFAYRATYPEDLFATDNPVGPKMTDGCASWPVRRTWSSQPGATMADS